MAHFRHIPSRELTNEIAEQKPQPLPDPPAADDSGKRNFWQHWDYLLSMVPALAEFGVPILDAVGLTLCESIIAEQRIDDTVGVGDVLIEKGTRVVPRMFGLLTGMGITKVMARPNPRVLVMALSKQAIPASFVVAGQAEESGAQVHRMDFIFTSPGLAVQAIVEQLVRADLVVTVGGLGEAGLDLRGVADQIGPHDFADVAITPGGNHGFALAEGQVPCLCLPGDVYSTFVLTKLLVEPMIGKLMGAVVDPPLQTAQLDQPLRVLPGVLTCVPATVTDGRMQVAGRPAGLAGLNTLYQANGLAVLLSDSGLLAVDAEVSYLALH